MLTLIAQGRRHECESRIRPFLPTPPYMYCIEERNHIIRVLYSDKHPPQALRTEQVETERLVAAIREVDDVKRQWMETRQVLHVLC